MIKKNSHLHIRKTDRGLRFPCMVRVRRGRGVLSALRNQRAFSLLEVLIALVILAVGMLGLAGLQIMSINGNRFGQEMTVASTLAQNKLEELRQTDFDSLVSSNDICINQASGVNFDREWTVTEDSPAAGMKTIDVTVSWPGTEADRQVNISTIVSES